jgi:glycosyltransferase involved in cell wall biosynthesis
VSEIADAGAARRWIITQIGSRELYACPVSFERRGALRRFYTDAWCGRFRSLVSRLPSPYWGLARRYHPELPPGKVTAFTAGMIRQTALHSLHRNPQTTDVEYANYIDIGKWFAGKVTRHLSRQALDPKRDAVFAFTTGALELIEWARGRGLLCVVDQLDPAKVDTDMIREEASRWEGWEAMPGEPPAAYYDRLGREWDAAQMIVVNSQFSRRALIQQGAAEKKIVVVPLAYEVEHAETPPRPPRRDKPLEVLWLGQIVLRKGIPYLFEAARRLAGENVRFSIAGRVGISEAAIKTAPENLTILGKVTREKALELYRSSDVFVLPTISDGFAITQLEAMSFGLPVITTPNCGDVVTPGEDGQIIPIRDPAALAAAIMRLANDRQLLAAMSANALVKSRQFTLDQYYESIVAAAARFA